MLHCSSFLHFSFTVAYELLCSYDFSFIDIYNDIVVKGEQVFHLLW